MHLRQLRVNTYRRFQETHTLRFAGKLTALLGPNEAGKTSLLHALAHLSHERPFEQNDITRDEDAGDEPLVEGRFFLDSADRDEISKVQGVKTFAGSRSPSMRTDSVNSP